MAFHSHQKHSLTIKEGLISFSLHNGIPSHQASVNLRDAIEDPRTEGGGYSGEGAGILRRRGVLQDTALTLSPTPQFPSCHHRCLPSAQQRVHISLSLP